MPTICLTMIVRDEAAVVARCIASVRDLVHSWAVVDTGSTDGTQAIVRHALAGLSGMLVERPWVNFGHNRTEALALARPLADYTLVIDADDELLVRDPAALAALTADCYAMEIEDAGTRYWRRQLFRNALAWRYVGVLHEFPATDGMVAEAGLSGVAMRRNHDGARRKAPDRFRHDAAVLEAALAAGCEGLLEARYVFYLAQSYADSGQPERALETYERRARMGFWDEERFVSLYRAAGLMAGLGRPCHEVVATFEAAATICPQRAEAWYGASRYCRDRGDHEAAYRFAQRAIAVPQPASGLFVEPWIYQYGALDEYALNAYWSGQYWECADASLCILAAGLIPPAERPRLIANARVALGHLRPAP